MDRRLSPSLKGAIRGGRSMSDFFMEGSGDTELIITMFLFLTKHLVCDYFLQLPRHYLQKHIYGKWGGIEHAAIHAIGTYIILGHLAALVDFIIHYHVDWAKMRLNSTKGWRADNSEWFWYSLGVDQYLHYLTYLGLIIWQK